MRFRGQVSWVAFCLCWCGGMPALAADNELKGEIDGLIHRLEDASKGVFKWDGAEKMDYRQDGNTAIADIANARIVIDENAIDRKTGGPGKPQGPKPSGPKPPAAKEPAAREPGANEPVTRVVLDKIEIRRTPQADGTISFGLDLPSRVEIRHGDVAVPVMFKDAMANALVEGSSERVRELQVGFSQAKVEIAPGDAAAKDGFNLTLGPLSAISKLMPASDGSWKAPGTFELKNIQFDADNGTATGSIDRIGATGEADGPDIAGLTRLRDRLDAAQQSDLPPDERGKIVLSILPDMLQLYSVARTEFTVEGVKLAQDKLPLVTLGKAGFGLAVTGLTGNAAALRITFNHDNLSVGASVPNSEWVPRKGDLDIGLEEINSAGLRTILDGASKMTQDGDAKQQGIAKMMGAAATLAPVLRLHDLAIDLADVGVKATGEARDSLLSPMNYHAEGDVMIRGLTALPHLLGDDAPLTAFVPLLTELARPAADSSNASDFKLASAPPQWLQINGQDVGKWFAAQPKDGPRLLRIEQPPLTGDDVRAVQRALAEKKVPGAEAAPYSGAYGGTTAAAVARFQKDSGLNEDGVVDAMTRAKLGIIASAAPGVVRPAPDASPVKPGTATPPGMVRPAPNATPVKPR